LSNYKNAKAFFKGIAQTTHGRFLNLGQAQLLPDVIIGGSAEELDLKKIEDEVETEVAKVKSETPTLADADVEHIVHKNLASKGLKTWHLDITHQDAYIPNESIFMESTTLSSAKAKIECADSPMTSAPTSGGVFGLTMPSFLTDIFGSSTPTPAPAPTSAYRSPVAESAAPREYSTQSANVYNDTVSYEQVAKIMKKKR